MSATGMNVAIRRSDPAIPLPEYESVGAAGMDLRAYLPEAEHATGRMLDAGARMLVPTGLSVAIPHGLEIQIRPRSGLALKHGLMVLNTPGTIDADYRGEIGVILHNAGKEPVTISHGQRIAQAVLAPVVRCNWIEADTLPETERGSGGFGSTGS